MADRDILSLVWGETAGLSPVSNSSATLSRLYAVTGKLAKSAQDRGLAGRLNAAPAPRADETAALEKYNTMKTAVDAVQNGTWQSETALPARAVLWPIDERGMPLRNRRPAAAEWITKSDAVHGGDFTSGPTENWRTYRLFESPIAAGEGELPLISGYSGSGAAPIILPWYRNWNWRIGLAGAALFIFAMFNILWSASSISQGYDLLSGRQAADLKEFVKSKQPLSCPRPALEGLTCNPLGNDATVEHREKQANDVMAFCSARLDAWSGNAAARRAQADGPADGYCLGVIGTAIEFASQRLVIRNDGMLAQAMQTVGYWLFSWYAPSTASLSVSLGVPLILMMIGVIGLLVGLGRGFTGKPLGALLSPQGRYSLALAQVTFWTVLVLTSFVAISVFNAGLISERLRDIGDAAHKAFVYPEIPQAIWLVLGISFASTAISSFIKTLEGGDTPTVKFFVDPGRLGVTPARRASIADWFLGEEGENKDRIDISRVQMVLITAGLLAAYGNQIFAFTRDLTIPAMIAAITATTGIIKSLPPVNESMAALLGVSHATYLLSKAAEYRKAQQGTQTQTGQADPTNPQNH